MENGEHNADSGQEPMLSRIQGKKKKPVRCNDDICSLKKVTFFGP
jgi:hypothetical protein